MKRGKIVGLILITVLVTVTSFMVASHADAVGFSQSISDGANSAHGVDQPADLFGQSGTFRTITNVMLYLVGAISVIMLIIGGIRYVVSGGDSTAVQGAKNTILYAIVGIVVAILAYAVVSFVIGSFAGSGNASTNGVAPTNT